MKKRAYILCGFLGLACLPSFAAKDDIPRTPGGRPDLSGNYDVSNLTPWERDPKYGDNLYMTGDDARKIEDAAATVLAEDDASRRAADRGALPSVGDENFRGVGGYNRFWIDRGTKTFTVDGRYRTSVLTDPPDGRFPPKTDEGEKRLAALPQFSYENSGTAWWLASGDVPYEGPESLTLPTRCIYHSRATIPVSSTSYNNLKTITQTDSTVVILIEWMHWARIIRLDSEHLTARHSHLRRRLDRMVGGRHPRGRHRQFSARSPLGGE